MMRRVALLAMVAGFLLPATAHAISTSLYPGGMLITRSVEDTSTSTFVVSVSSGYKGGGTLTATYPPHASASYTSSITLPSFTGDTRSVFVPLPEPSGWHLVYLNPGGVGRRVVVRALPAAQVVAGSVDAALTSSGQSIEVTGSVQTALDAEQRELALAAAVGIALGCGAVGAIAVAVLSR